MTCVGGGFKQEKKLLDCRTWSELLEKQKNNKKRDDRLIWSPLQSHPSVFPGSPLCFSSMFPSSDGASVISALMWDAPNPHQKAPQGLPTLPSDPAHRLACSKGEVNMTTWTGIHRTHINTISSWVRLHAASVVFWFIYTHLMVIFMIFHQKKLIFSW